MLNQTDDPQHQRLRSLVNRGFTPRAVQALTAELRRRGAGLLDDGRHRAVRLRPRVRPRAAVAGDLPRARRAPRGPARAARLAGRGRRGRLAVDPVRARRCGCIRGYAVDLIADKRAHPDAGIMSTIVHARDDDGVGLSDEELIAFFALLFPAGAETTRSALAGGGQGLRRPPRGVRPTAGRSGRSCRRRSRRSSAGRRRRSTSGGRRSRDVELAGVPIAAGDKVTFWEMSANRDERVFADRTRSTSAAAPTRTSASAGAPTSASAPASPGSRSGSRSSCCSNGAPGSRPTGPTAWMPNNRLFGLKTLPVRLIPDA